MTFRAPDTGCGRLALVLACAAVVCAGAALGALRAALRAPLAALHRWLGRALAVALLALVLAFPVAAQPGSEDEPITAEVLEEEAPPARWAMGAWCPVRSEGRRDQSRDEPAEGEGEDQGQQEAGSEGELECDAGAAVALLGKDFRQGRLSLVGVLGAQSLGIGGAWTFGRQGGHPLSVAVGVVAPYDGSGIVADEWAFALGATVSVFGRR